MSSSSSSSSLNGLNELAVVAALDTVAVVESLVLEEDSGSEIGYKLNLVDGA